MAQMGASEPDRAGILNQTREFQRTDELTTAAMSGALVTREGIVGVAVAAVLASGVLLGLAGTALHLQGTRSQIGGLSLRKLQSGPPPALPMAYALTGLLGMGALIWNA
jgi:hypothetical protein